MSDSGNNSIQQGASSSGSQQPTLRRALGVFDGVALLIGITIGAGIFSTPQIIAGYLESFRIIVLLWIGVGAYVFVGGLIYAELGTRLPETGGEYVYMRRCFGPFAGFMFGWAQLFIIRTSPAAGLAMITADYLGYFVRLKPWVHTGVALTVIVFFGTLNYIGVQRASGYQKVASVLKIGGLFALAVIGMILVQGHENLLDTRAAATGGLGSLGNAVAALMLIVFSYTGWDRVGYVAGEMKNPRRTVPLSLIYGLGAIVVVYILVNMVYHQTLGMEGVRGSTIVASAAATKLLGPVGAGVIAILVMISTTSSINGTMMAAPRAYYAMARDGLFFKWLDFVHPRYRTPTHAILAHCIWGAVILLVRKSFETIMAGMVFAILIFLVFNTLAVFKLRRRNVGGDSVFKVPLYPWLPWIFLAGIIALIVFRAYFEWQKSLTDMAFIATGIPISFFWLRKAKKR
jgi:APA family basic amino acid/polyamine antiporter